ncbi:hypothetical protein [Chloroflexus sp.]|uniref:hypothetical protein n=1 Tax=Chloroflexus sp. TaxID=1904827 RepID=UPI00404AEA38
MLDIYPDTHTGLGRGAFHRIVTCLESRTVFLEERHHHSTTLPFTGGKRGRLCWHLFLDPTKNLHRG